MAASSISEWLECRIERNPQKTFRTVNKLGTTARVIFMLADLQ